LTLHQLLETNHQLRTIVLLFGYVYCMARETGG